MKDHSELLSFVENFVLEENKIVTYKWLSHELNIHINVAKRVLQSFEEQNKNIEVCYVVGEQLVDGSVRIFVTKRENLSKIESVKQIIFKHIFSIQKSVNNDLKVSLFSAHCSQAQNGDIKNGLNAITCKESVIKPIGDLKKIALVAQKNKLSESSKKPGSDNKKSIFGFEKENVPKTISVNKNHSDNENNKSDSASPKKTGIAAMFANQKDVKKADNKEKLAKESQKKKPKGLAAFFNHGNQSSGKFSNKVIEEKKNVKDSVNDCSEISEEVSEMPQVNEDIDKDDKKCEEKSVSVKISKTKVGEKTSKSKVPTKVSKKRKKNVEEEEQTKKRKRIVVLSDSESSDEDHEERPPSPIEREPTPPPPLSDDENNSPSIIKEGKKARKKKLVEKNFLDDDGFLVTQKEYVFVSSSEDDEADSCKDKKEVNEPIKINKEDKTLNEGKSISKNIEPDKKPSPQKVKQSSIMNFFGKKS